MRSFVAVDLETTGLRPDRDEIIEIGALKYVDGVCVDTFSQLVKPNKRISVRIKEITGIDNEMVADAPKIETVLPAFVSFVGDEGVLLGHNLRFDYSFLKTYCKMLGIAFQMQGLDTLKLARALLPDLEKKNLGMVSQYYGIVNPNAHRAFTDAKTTADVYWRMYENFHEEKSELFLPKEMIIKVKKIEPATAKQKNYLLDLIKCHKIQGETFFKEMDVEMESLTKSQASKCIDRIILQYGRRW
ncbi:MAG: 3'-5' exoribonuclease [Lachnospiraceae bacterium]|nr:3'-5' exoribonuclease [Lachnospiraceae bacterium]